MRCSDVMFSVSVWSWELDVFACTAGVDLPRAELSVVGNWSCEKSPGATLEDLEGWLGPKTTCSSWVTRSCSVAATFWRVVEETCDEFLLLALAWAWWRISERLWASNASGLSSTPWQGFPFASMKRPSKQSCAEHVQICLRVWRGFFRDSILIGRSTGGEESNLIARVNTGRFGGSEKKSPVILLKHVIV